MTNEEYMRVALDLAKTAMGHTSPNPMVGCVVVKDGNIITKGCHERYGEYHAERNALTRCDEDLTGATMYVTLEPCCHSGKTPPCTDIIIERKIGKVFVGSLDPNPKVAGNGIKILKDHGIEVETGILEKECLELNEVFFHYITTKMPYVVMKYAMTLDGKIASYTGDSKWVSGEESRAHVQYLRNKYKGILVGIGTVLADDPMLNCRIEGGVDPVRIICDSKLQIPMDSNIVSTAKDVSTIVACGKNADVEKIEKLKNKDIEVIVCDKTDEVDIKYLLEECGKRTIDSILVEGGGKIHGSFLEKELVDKVYCYIAPKLIGGESAKGPIAGTGIQLMKDAVNLRNVKIRQFGDDFCISGNVTKQEAN